MITRLDAAAANTIAGGMVPGGSENPTVVIDRPATVKAWLMPPVTNGHSNSVNPMKEIPSQATNWTIRIVTPWGRAPDHAAGSRHALTATMNARFTIRSVHRSPADCPGGAR